MGKKGILGYAIKRDLAHRLPLPGQPGPLDRIPPRSIDLDQ